MEAILLVAVCMPKGSHGSQGQQEAAWGRGAVNGVQGCLVPGQVLRIDGRLVPAQQGLPEWLAAPPLDWQRRQVILGCVR